MAQPIPNARGYTNNSASGHARVHYFIMAMLSTVMHSARASNLDASEKLFPKTAVAICSWELTLLHERDRCIAEFLVKIQSFLEKNEPPKRLTELFLGIFENMMTRDDKECKWLLARSLTLIAGAIDALTFDELLYALSLYTPPSKGEVSRTVKDLEELRKNLCREVDEGRIRQLLRPFAVLEPTVGFVHQSLKETVLEYPALTDAAPSTVGGGIEGIMLRTCVDYLLLDDFIGAYC